MKGRHASVHVDSEMIIIKPHVWVT